MKDGPLTLDAIQTSLLKDVAFDAPFRVAGRGNVRAATAFAVEMLRGRDAISAMAGMLRELCERTGQAGAMDCLDYFLSAPTSLEKIPYLMLVGLDAGVTAARATADDVAGAVLLYEYRMAGRGAKVFATDDIAGWRTVIAPGNIRAQVADVVCRTLLERGALTVMISFEETSEARSSAIPRTGLTQMWHGPASRVARRTRAVPRYLPLGETIDATLATLGRHTRRNLRYYRRRLEMDMGALFVPCVAMSRDEFLEINRTSINPVTEALAAWRYDASEQTPGAFIDGIRARDGRWLSLIGGRRNLQTTEIDWQINLAGFARYSLSTGMRAYVLEHEIGLGMRALAFTGGTPHSMRHSFVCEDTADVIVQRRSARAWLLRRMARWIFPEKNFLGQALRDEELQWGIW